MPPAVGVKISAELAESAREEAEAADRSLTGQIEHWAKLGRAVDSLVPAQVAGALKRYLGNFDAIEDPSLKKRVTSALGAVRTMSPEAIRAELGLANQILLEPDPENSGGMIEIHPDGTRIRGRLEGRRFVPSDL